MKCVIHFLSCGLLALTSPAWAQWNDYPQAGLPRTADGKLDMDAPTPRMANGKPDLSGMWDKSSAYADDLASSVQGGAPLQAWARKLVDRRIARGGVDDPSNRCLPQGPVALHLFSPAKMVSLPDRIITLFEVNTTYRQFFLDGRPFPKDPLPTYMGYSVGHWEGDTLVVESIGFNGKFWIDPNGKPVTDKLRLIERFRRTSFGRLEHEFTFDDPGAYTKPWTVKVNFTYVADSELMESYCEDNRFAEEQKQAPEVGVEPNEPQGPSTPLLPIPASMLENR